MSKTRKEKQTTQVCMVAAETVQALFCVQISCCKSISQTQQLCTLSFMFILHLWYHKDISSPVVRGVIKGMQETVIDTIMLWGTSCIK